MPLVESEELYYSSLEIVTRWARAIKVEVGDKSVAAFVNPQVVHISSLETSDCLGSPYPSYVVSEREYSFVACLWDTMNKLCERLKCK